MPQYLYGAPAADAVEAQAKKIVENLPAPPVLAIVRTGGEGDDLVYEKSIRAACARCGVTVWTAELPGYVPQDVLVRAVHKISRDKAIHGVIVMCPRQYDAGLVGAAIGRSKDVDGFSFAEGGVFAPCTAAAVLAIMDAYGIDCLDKKVTVVGRSPLVGGPVARLLEGRGADVSVCCRATENPEEMCRGAQILISAAGCAGLIDKKRVSTGQIIIDVGTNVLPDGSICGDVDPDAALCAAAVTPVPGGVGAVTPYILALHTAKAAETLEKSGKNC